METNDQSSLVLRSLPSDVIEPMQACIRFADRKYATKIADLLSLLQSFQHGMHPTPGRKKIMNYSVLVELTSIYIFASELFFYANRYNEGLVKGPDLKRVACDLEMMGFSREKHPVLYWLLGPEDFEQSTDFQPFSDFDDGFDIIWIPKHP